MVRKIGGYLFYGAYIHRKRIKKLDFKTKNETLESGLIAYKEYIPKVQIRI